MPRKDIIVVFGANGQVGSALKKLLNQNSLCFTRAEADFSQPENVKKLLDNLDFVPRAIINAAAYTAVDKAEEEEHLAELANAETPAVIAAFCKAKAIPFIHYSTDYVFPGDGNTPWKEEDNTAPLNAYGRSKLRGEQRIQGIGGKYLIFRTSWVYDADGKNFMNTMLRLGAERDSLSIVNDQFGAPTFAGHIAQATLDALTKAEASPAFPSGVYHMCNNGITTWHEFALTIFDTARKAGTTLKISAVNGIPSSAYPTPAKRPLNSRLDCSKLHTTFGISMPTWQEGLTQALQEKFLKEKAA